MGWSTREADSISAPATWPGSGSSFSTAAVGRTLPAFSAEGRGGQFIIVVPDLRLVAVFTGWNDTLRSSPVRMFEQRILPAVLGG